MAGRARMFAGVLIRRAVAAESYPACLACAQMNPMITDLHTFFALTPVRLFD